MFLKEKLEEYKEIKKKKDSMHGDLAQLNSHLAPIDEQKLKVELKLKKQKELLSVKSKQINEIGTVGRGLSARLNELNEKANEVKK